MAWPTPYNRLKNFTQYALDHPTATYNPSDHDAELDAVELTLDGLTTDLALIQRNDGKLSNQSVHPDSLAAATKALIGAGNTGQLNWTPRGLWATATAYTLGNVVESGGNSYVCVTAHTSGTFNTDRAAGKWISIGTASAVARFLEVQTASAGQTIFNLASGVYTPGVNALEVYVNGLRLPPADYTETSTTRVTLNYGLAAGDSVLFVLTTAISVDTTATAQTVTYTPTYGALAGIAHTVASFLDKLAQAGTNLGAALIGFMQSGTAPTTRTMQDKERDIIASADHADVANTIAAAGQAGGVYVPADLSIGTARKANADGVYFWGPGKLKWTSDATRGTRVQNAAGRDRLLAWGSEYCYQLLGKITAAAACTVRVSGDSRVSNLATALTPLLSPYPTLTFTSVANSGKNTNDWVNTYLAADIVAAPDVLIWYWGMNDCAGLSRTLAQFETDLRAGLTTYRAAVPVTSGAVVLVVPNASSDGTNGRDPAWAEKMRHIIRCAAEDFSCGFVDSYALFQDAYNSGIGGTYPWLDDTFADGIRGIHPQASFSRAIAGAVLDVMIPPGFQKFWSGPGMVSNLANADSSTTAAGLITAYPKGVSIRRALAANGWPVDGFVMTIYAQDGTGGGMQIHWANNASYSGVYLRKGASTAWQEWGSMSAPFANPTSPAKTDALTTYPNGLSVSRATTGNGWDLDGYVWTFRQTLDGSYGWQELHEYNTTAPMLRRQWINTGTPGWGVWRQVGPGNSTTQTGTTYTVPANINNVIANGSATITLTLPTASSWTDREIRVVNWVAFTVVSNASNVVPQASGAAGTAILAATAGKWALLKSDGTNWNIVQSG